MSLCISSTRVPRYKCMKCVHGFIPLSKIKLNVINTDLGGLYCPGIVHLLIFSYVHCTLTMRSLSLSAPFALTVLKALTVHSQSVYFSLTVRLAFIYIGQSRFFHSELQSDRIGLGVLKTK